MKKISILGIRGVPAAHGGFETFAEYLAPYLHNIGWEVTVYCQTEGNGLPYVDHWQGIRRFNIPVEGDGPASTIVFDWKSIGYAAKDASHVVLTLGYNTALFCARLRLSGKKNVINMDGIEWRRDKWGALAKVWFWLNDWAGCILGNHLIADHPEIKQHLQTRVSPRKITILPYGAEKIVKADTGCLSKFGLESERFCTLIARPEPENSILEIVSAFSRVKRGVKLVVLGNYKEDNEYHCAVKKAASDEVMFIGAVYDRGVVGALRFQSILYAHGHQVGGTNPSLVEALGAGNPVVAHNNKFNRWVAGDAGVYFSNEDECARVFDTIFNDKESLAKMSVASRERHEVEFTWTKVLADYERLLSGYA